MLVLSYSSTYSALKYFCLSGNQLNFLLVLRDRNHCSFFKTNTVKPAETVAASRTISSPTTTKLLPYNPRRGALHLNRAQCALAGYKDQWKIVINQIF